MNRGSPSRKIPSLATGARPAEPSRVSAPWPPYRTTQATQTVDRKRGSTKMSTRPRDTVSFSVRATPRDQNPRSKEKTKNHSSLLRVSPAYRSGSIPRTPPRSPCSLLAAIRPGSAFAFYTLAVYSRFLRGSGLGWSVYFFSASR